MTTAYGFSNGEPGWTGSLASVESNIFWGNDPSKQVQYLTADIVSTAVDSGNTPTTLLRAGLILGKVTSTGQYKEYSPTGTDGSQQAVAVLPIEINMLDPYTAAAANRVASVVICGPVRASSLVGLDNMSRKQLEAGGILFDDTRGSGFGIPYIRELNKAADYTVVAADNGTLFTASAAVNFTLPTLAAGLHFLFYNDADSNMTVTSAAGDDLIVFNDVAADSVAFSTAGGKIGGSVEVIANQAGTKWRVFSRSAGANTITVVT